MLYNCKIDGDHYRITKFSPDLEVESSYLTSDSECDCPAGHRHTCRHRQMLPRFIDKSATRGQWFLDFDRDHWVRAVGEVEFESDIAPEGAQAGSIANVTATEIDERMAQLKGPNNPVAEYLVDQTFEQLQKSAATHGFTMLDLAATSPAELYNTIADAVGEPQLRPAPKSDLRRI